MDTLGKGVSASWTLSITTSVGMDVHSAMVSQAVGTAAFAGLAFMLVLVPVNGIAVAQMESIREEVIQLTDSRVTMMNELLSGIRIVKFTTLEEHFKSRILEVRRKELDLLTAQSYWHAFTSFLVFATPTLTSVCTFVVYAALGNTLDAKSIFTALSLFNLLRVPLSFLPVVIFSMVESSVALDRVSAFLTAPEVDPKAVEQTGPRTPIAIADAVFGWDSNGPPTLGGRAQINITIPCGSLCIIVGRVGSGKSSLLSALLGMIDKRQGRVLMPSGAVAFCPQQAWLANDTVRGNILFGNSFFPGAYEDAIKVCNLKSDLRLLPGGDLTEIDEAPPHPDGMVAGAATYRAKEDREPYKADEKKQLQTDEERAVGAVSTDVISRYITACGLSFLRGISAVEASIRASRQLHVQMLTSVLRAPAGFFDVTPLGRILARFSKDLDSLDTSLADGLNSFCTVVSMTVGTLCVVLIALPPFAIALVPLGAFYSQIMQYYWSDGRDSAPEQQLRQSLRVTPEQGSAAFAFSCFLRSGSCFLHSGLCVLRSDDVSLVGKEKHPLKWAKLLLFPCQCAAV
eukprot:gene17826-biopygen32250